MSSIEILFSTLQKVSSNPNHLLNECNTAGDTPLHIACKNDKPECVQALLCAGADVNVTGTLDEEYPIHAAMKSSSTRCVKEIIQMYPKQLNMQVRTVEIRDRYISDFVFRY